MTFKSHRENKKVATIIAEAIQDQRFVTIRIFDEKGDQQITGIITKIDQELRRVKLSHEKGTYWIPFDDILNADWCE